MVEQIGDCDWLVIVDAMERALGAAGSLGELLARCPRLTILVTSVTVLGLRAEWHSPVPPLPVPADPAGEPLEELAASPAVAPFVERARAVRYDFAITEASARAVAEICRRLEGMPLAIELAAARVRLLDPETLLRRLSRSLDALGSGAVDLPERQRTLRATVDWSVGLLNDAERSLLDTMAVFVDGWTIEAAADVAGLDEDRVLELSEALARHSLIQLDHTALGVRLRMLETVREFVAEHLAARPDRDEIRRRHAEHYRALAERADRSLRGTGSHEWLERLQAEAGNLAAAVRWYQAEDSAPLPHLFRVLYLFWMLRDHMGEARGWVAQRLRPLLAGIGDPFLHAMGRLVTGWTAAIAGDLDGFVEGLSAGAGELVGQDEPFWTATALGTAGLAETDAGRYDDALEHLTAMRDIVDRSDNPWLTAWSRAQLGSLAAARGQRREARELLDEGLAPSLAAHSTRGLTLCLVGFARLALVEGDHERAARLAGAVEGLRQRVGLGAWPLPRRRRARPGGWSSAGRPSSARRRRGSGCRARWCLQCGGNRAAARRSSSRSRQQPPRRRSRPDAHAGAPFR